MAKPGELADLVSSAFGAETATVRQQARALRDAGLMSKEKGGRGAGNLSPRDATNLVIAAAGTKSVARSASFVQRPGGLVSPKGAWNAGFISVPELAALAPAHTFADAIEALIAAATSGSLQKAAEELEGGPVDLISDVAPSLNVEVTILGPLPRGSILIEQTVLADDDQVYRYKDNFERHFYSDRPTKPGAGNLAWLDMARGAELNVDLRTQMTFTHRTIAAIGLLLADTPKDVAKK